MDVNKTTHSGIAVTNPTLATLGGKTPIAIFTLKVQESWTDRNGVTKYRDNLIKFEALSSKSYWVKTNVKAGKRYIVDGYIRHEQINGENDTKIRIFHIEEITNEDYKRGRIEGLKEAMGRALTILKSSKDLTVAEAKLEVLLEEL